MVAAVLAISAAAGALVLLRDWRLLLPLLFVFDLLRIALLWWAAPLSQARGTVLLAELATAVGVAAILLLSASQWAGAPRQRPGVIQLAVTLAALVPAGLAVWFLVDAYAVSGDRGVDTAVVFGVLCGLLVLIRARDVLELGLGLLVLAGSAKLLYFVTSPRLLVLQVGLWEALSLGLALVTAAFGGLLYRRLYTLQLDRLPDGEPQ